MWALPLLVGLLVAWGGGQHGLTTGPAAAALVASAAVFLSISQGGPARALRSWVEAHERILLLVALAAIFAWGLSAALLRFASYGTRIDLALYDNIAWNTTHGRVYEGLEGNHLAYHATAIPLLTLPFYVLTGDPRGLLLAQSLAVVVAALPLHALARRRLPPLPSIALAVALPLLPGLFSRHVDDFQETPFVALPLLLALLFFEQGRLRGFLASFVAAMLVIEYYALALSSFSLYALLRRRSAIWVLAPAGASLAWSSLAFLVLMPLSRGQDYPYAVWGLQYYVHLGSTPLGVLQTLLRDPLASLLAPSPGQTMEAGALLRLEYARDLFMPFLFILPFGAPEALLAIPELLNNLFTAQPAILSVVKHHSVLASTALMAASVTTLGRLHTFDPVLVRGLATAVLCLAAFSPSTVYLALTPRALLASEPASWDKAIDLIGPEESVATTMAAASHLSRRRDLLLAYDPLAQEAVRGRRAQAVLLDRWSVSPQEHALHETVANDPAYRLRYARGRVALFGLDLPTPLAP